MEYHTIGDIVEEHNEGNWDADRLKTDAGSEGDNTFNLFQPEWPEVTYHTTDFYQAGMSIVDIAWTS